MRWPATGGAGRSSHSAWAGTPIAHSEGQTPLTMAIVRGDTKKTCLCRRVRLSARRDKPVPGAPRPAGAVRRRAGRSDDFRDVACYGQVADTILTDVTRKDGMVVVDDCVVLLVDGELCDVVDEDVTLSTVPVICTL